MKTDIYEADPFTSRKGRLLITLDTDYRFEKNDEFSVESDGSRTALRVMFVQVRIKEGQLSRDLVAMRL